jgi:hypothetical protein
MTEAQKSQEYQESKIEDDPILGPVLNMPDGQIHPLTWFERLLVALHLSSAKSLGGRYAKLAGG